MDFVLVRQDDLHSAYTHQDVRQRVGTLIQRFGKVAIDLLVEGDRLYCVGRDSKVRLDWSKYRNNWGDRWPKIEYRASSAK